MEKEKNESRIRLLRLLQLLETDSDAEHPISTPECIRLLKERWGIDSFRITIGRDMEALVMAGYDVRTIHSTQNKYYLGSRTFEQAELKLLTDAVASSKFITATKSKVLTDKLAAMANRYFLVSPRELIPEVFHFSQTEVTQRKVCLSRVTHQIPNK